MDIYRIASDRERIRGELKRIGVDDYAISMDKKGICLNLLVREIRPAAANIIKQEAIASGMDAALKRGSVSCSVEFTDILIMGQLNAYPRLIKRLSRQPFGLKELSPLIEAAVKKEESSGKYVIAGDKKISLETPKIMGILNVTPDSFSDGGIFLDNKKAASRIDGMLEDGADIIDIGGMSSRPSAKHIAFQEEIKRIDYAVKYACGKNALVSVDTCYAETAAFALEAGALIVNDISGLASGDMRKVASEYGAGVCLMHMKGKPENMQENTDYGDIMLDIKEFFSERLELAGKDGIKRDSIILDPGFGFGKSAEQNYFLLKYMGEFKSFGLPLLAGVSRKSMIGEVTGTPTEERLAGTIALNAAALLNGASLIRVHDVKEAVQTVKTIDHLIKAQGE